MPNEPKKYPKPQGLEVDRLHDAAWDLRDYRSCWIPLGEDRDKWLYWLRRYEGFGDEEIELGAENDWNFEIKLKD